MDLTATQQIAREAVRAVFLHGDHYRAQLMEDRLYRQVRAEHPGATYREALEHVESELQAAREHVVRAWGLYHRKPPQR